MEYPELVQSVSDLWSTFISVDGFAWFISFAAAGGFILGSLVCVSFVFVGDLCEFIHAAVPLVKRSINERKAKKSGKLTTEQRFELLEEKIDSIADIVISTSPEVK